MSTLNWLRTGTSTRRATPTGPALRIAPAQRINFRFGLTGRRWGEHGPVALLVDPSPAAALIARLLASGRQVIALDPLGPGATPEEYALAIDEAVVEIPDLEKVIGRGAVS